MDRARVPLLIFDGDCGFCTAAAGWAAKGWPGAARAVPWQHLGADGLERLGLDVIRAQDAAWWVDAQGGLARGHRAVGKALAAGRGWRRVVGNLLLVPPVSTLGAAGYRVVARHRHRLPGATPACRTNP